MNVANITATATIHGFTCGCGEDDGIRPLDLIMPQTAPSMPALDVAALAGGQKQDV
jgi:hypothetical protein